ncbi:LOW QUALITY PROTEIN: regulator of G-protein signaling protein-like [Urocitellus parryii]
MPFPGWLHARVDSKGNVPENLGVEVRQQLKYTLKGHQYHQKVLQLTILQSRNAPRREEARGLQESHRKWVHGQHKVFGQTPFYLVEKSQWNLWPEIPRDLIAKYKGLLTWLEKYRLPFFCKTNLCFSYILCQELISFIKSEEGAKMMRWKMADQWLLEKCIGGVRGMWRFCSYLKGSAGEELVDFWILAEKILSIDEMDLKKRDYYLSLLLMLKANHLQSGSRVVKLCNVNINSLLNLSIWHPNQSTTRRETLSHMQKVALFKVQSYWLPNFYTHAKVAMASEEACQGLMQEYETRLYSVCHTHSGELPLNMSIRKSFHCQKQYSSKKARRRMWHMAETDPRFLESSPKPDSRTMPTQEMSSQKMVTQMSSLTTVASSKESIISSLENDDPCAKKFAMKKSKGHLLMEGLFETRFSTQMRTSTPIINYSSQMTIHKAMRKSLPLGYTYWALCADIHAGSPFRHYLKKMKLKVERQLLDLWQDLHHFLRVLMNNRNNGNAIFRHMLGHRICELYLNEQLGPRLPLKSQTIQGLKKLLSSGDVTPWIPKAQREICKILSPCYNEFLNEEDYWFLVFTTQTRFIKNRCHRRKSISKEENILLYKRMQKSLELTQALANMEKMDSMQWPSVATENLRQAGSLQVELQSPVFLEDINNLTFEELCFKYPKVAIKKISDDYKLYCEKAPLIDFKVQIVKEPKVITAPQRKISFSKKSGTRKPSVRPRNLTEVLLNSQYLELFREFLREHNAESPLLFLMAVQRMNSKANEKTYMSSLENIIQTFFHGKIPPEEMLQCDAPLIKEVTEMSQVSTTTLLMVQSHVMKSLDEKWFKDYQDIFPFPPPSPEVEPEAPALPKKPSKITMYLLESQKKGWLKMTSFIKSFCKYRKFISNPSKRQEFIDYLHLEMCNSKDNFPGSPSLSVRPIPLSTNIRSADPENGEITLLKRRIYGHRVIIVNFAINDLYFLSEIERFNDLVSSAHMLQVNRTYTENDLLLLRAKINIILRLFLNSDIPPRLRVNISESQKEAILAAVSEGHLDRTTFHGAVMSIFPVIMYFWKRFCTWKAARSYLQHMGKGMKDRKCASKPAYKYPPSSGGVKGKP